MKLTSPTGVRARLAALGHRPVRMLGQNFLIDGNVLRILLDAAELRPGESVLEVGPGLGVVTEELLAAGCRVVAVEKDARLAADLRTRAHPDLTVLEADAMELDPSQLCRRHGIRKVVANLPYAIASPLLIELAKTAARPERMVVTVQKEVADRICARPGTKVYGLLSVWLQLSYEAERIKVVSRNCFWPKPDVASAIVRLRRRSLPLLEEPRHASVCALTKAMFSQRRKQLAPRLAKAVARPEQDAAWFQAWLVEQGLSPASRPEALSVEQWCRLEQTLALVAG